MNILLVHHKYILWTFACKNVSPNVDYKREWINVKWICFAKRTHPYLVN